MNRIGRAIEMVVLQSRWLVAPFLLGLIVGLGALLYKFVFKLFDFVTQVRPAPEEEMIVGVLKLVDLSLTANLLLIVICSSYENFVARIDPADHTHWPEGLIGIATMESFDGELCRTGRITETDFDLCCRSNRQGVVRGDGQLGPRGDRRVREVEGCRIV